MGADYGYFTRRHGSDKTPYGVDGDPVDCFIGPHPESEAVFIVNQVNRDGKFDEHKVILGARNEAEARKAYLSCYSPGWTGLGSIVQMTMPQFRVWLAGMNNRKFLDSLPVSKAVDKVGGKQNMALDFDTPARKMLTPRQWQERPKDYKGVRADGTASVLAYHPEHGTISEPVDVVVPDKLSFVSHKKPLREHSHEELGRLMTQAQTGFRDNTKAANRLDRPSLVDMGPQLDGQRYKDISQLRERASNAVSDMHTLHFLMNGGVKAPPIQISLSKAVSTGKKYHWCNRCVKASHWTGADCPECGASMEQGEELRDPRRCAKGHIFDAGNSDEGDSEQCPRCGAQGSVTKSASLVIVGFRDATHRIEGKMKHAMNGCDATVGADTARGAIFFEELSKAFTGAPDEHTPRDPMIGLMPESHWAKGAASLHPRKNVVYLNDSAAHAFHTAFLGDSARLHREGGQSGFDGAHAPAESLRFAADGYRNLASADHIPFSDHSRAALRAQADVFDAAAHRHPDAGAMILPRSDDKALRPRFGDLRDTVRHERTHGRLDEAGAVPFPLPTTAKTKAALESHPAYKGAIAALKNQGYDPDDKPALHEELAAHIAGGHYRDLGLSHEDAGALIGHLATHLAAVHGVDAVKHIFSGAHGVARRALKEHGLAKALGIS